ncbi:methyl-accepting chemotaxis protein [Labilibacter marinus]|uniref:methyl-accepting chemotaxis protein n=1 Tax=Labilibacter marinus TaxID=1477105 RepID=UPI00094FEB1B|nr:methyl-accepting chemotaxis protein [Labilibacter marinus]
MVAYLWLFLLGVVCFCVWLFLKNKKLKKLVESHLHFPQIEKEVSAKDTLSDEKQQEMERLSIVAKQTDNAIMIMDPKGNIQWINNGFTRMYEYTFEEFTRLRGTNILQTSFNPLVRQSIEQCLHTKEPAYYEAINKMPSGKEIWTHTSLSPVLNEQGDIINLVAVDSDISKRKEAGDALVQRVEVLTDKIAILSQQQNSLNTYTHNLMDEVSASNSKIHETDQIINFIKDMSDKIKLMGLNASIEAQRVGEGGSGFRVISGEIVQMSDLTKRYSHEISEIIQQIQDSSKTLHAGKELVAEASHKYEKTVKELKQEVSLVHQVVAELN